MRVGAEVLRDIAHAIAFIATLRGAMPLPVEASAGRGRLRPTAGAGSAAVGGDSAIGPPGTAARAWRSNTLLSASQVSIAGRGAASPNRPRACFDRRPSTPRSGSGFVHNRLGARPGLITSLSSSYVQPCGVPWEPAERR